LIAAPVGGGCRWDQLRRFDFRVRFGRQPRERPAPHRGEVQCHRRDIGGFVRDAQAVVTQQVKTPPGYFILYLGGQFENAQQANAPAADCHTHFALLVFVLIYACFSSLRNTLTIIFNIPIALVGSRRSADLGIPLSVPPSLDSSRSSASRPKRMVRCPTSTSSQPGMELHEAVITGASVRLRAELLSALIGTSA